MDIIPTAAGRTFHIRIATIADVPAIDWLDTFGASPHRNISRAVDRYFGSVDPSIHEQNVIFLAEMLPDIPTDLPFRVVGKAELLLAPASQPSDVGYIKRVVVHPALRGQGVARAIIQRIEEVARDSGLRHLDLHVWEGNTSALRLYESLGFAMRHRELYLRQELADPAPEAPRLAERKVLRDEHDT